MFITIYGINNIGKTTHAKRLVEKLKSENIDAIYLKYPIYNIKPTGEIINSFLRSGKKQKISEEELQMWYTLNRYQFQPKLENYLKNGKIIIAEDYVGTALAWGAAKGADLKWLEEMNKHLIKEDFAILLDGERTINATEKNHIHEENNVLIKKCTLQYKKLAKKYKWQIINAGGAKDKEKTFNELYKMVKKVLNTKD